MLIVLANQDSGCPLRRRTWGSGCPWVCYRAPSLSCRAVAAGRDRSSIHQALDPPSCPACICITKSSIDILLVWMLLFSEQAAFGALHPLSLLSLCCCPCWRMMQEARSGLSSHSPLEQWNYVCSTNVFSFHMYRDAYACIHACMYFRMYASMYVCMYICIYVCMHACMHVCIYVCMYVRTYARRFLPNTPGR